MKRSLPICLAVLALAAAALAEDFPKPYDRQCTERENVFEFAKKPSVQLVAKDKYEITFAVKGYCDVTAGMIDEKGVVVRHLGSGVLGKNAPAPFQKDSLEQKLHWNGKDDLDVYVKEPGKLKVRVRLGLKPVFDRLLGTTSPKSQPGTILGFAADEDGVYVFSKNTSGRIRKFDHDGNYVQSLLPPPSGLPESKLGGRTYIEYEPGKKAHHAAQLVEDLGGYGMPIAGLSSGVFDKDSALQAAIVNRKIVFCSTRVAPGPKYTARSFYVFTDGSTDVKGLAGRLLSDLIIHSKRYLAASPDGKWIYLAGVAIGGVFGGKLEHAVFRFSADGDEEARPFVGKFDPKNGRSIPGSDNESFNNPIGIDCDTAGRLYVADRHNNRIQVFSPDGKYLKTIPAPGISLVQVHRKTGAIYALHTASIKGKAAGRLTRFGPFDAPAPQAALDFVNASVMALDSWAPRPRIWIRGCVRELHQWSKNVNMDNVVVIEDSGAEFKTIMDFDEEAKKESGENYIGEWSAHVFDHVNCDPVREQLYYQAFRKDAWLFDLATGRKLSRVKMPCPNDIAFDKKGYMHVHLDPGFYMPGVVRQDPSQAAPFRDHLGRVYNDTLQYKEVPYDYGVEVSAPHKGRWEGGLPVKDQPGAKFFQDGFGVNMRGDVAVESNIYYIPKMEDEGVKVSLDGRFAKVARGIEPVVAYDGRNPYAEFRQYVERKQKLGEQVYYVPRRPGIPLAGGTVWTYHSSGELKQEAAVILRKLLLGLQIDEDGYLYFANDGARLIDGKPFLSGKGGNYGSGEPIEKVNRSPITYTVFKTKPKNVRWFLKNATVPMEPLPDRPTDVVRFGPFGHPEMGNGEHWVDGAEWMYAGLSPAVPAGCSCPSTRLHLDWFKRVYIPEGYRHSIGIVDTNGNLIMHLGRYGNLDDALKVKPGAEDIPLTMPRFISGTDNYLAFDDWGERLVVLKLDCHAEETAGIKMQ